MLPVIDMSPLFGRDTAARAVVAYAFDCRGLNRVAAHHLVRNPASGAVLERVGMRREGVLRQRDIFEKQVKPLLGEGKVAYVWVDALRFEMARELCLLLKDDFKVEIQP